MVRVRVGLAGALLIALLSCKTKDVPETCRVSSECGPGQSCDPSKLLCVAQPDAGASVVDAAARSDGPIADASSDAPLAVGDAMSSVDAEAVDVLPGPTDAPGTCRVPGDCDPAVPVCSAEGRCVRCVVDRDCPVAAPVCTDNQCLPCTRDSQCSALGPVPGVCVLEPLANRGRCAQESDVVVVQKNSMCGTADGSPSKPFCRTQEGVDKALMTTPPKIVLVVGDQATTGFTVASSTEPLVVVGTGGAIIAPGAELGILLTKGELYLRNLTIRRGEDTGVRAAVGTTLHMDSCRVLGNRGGGLQVLGGGFDISNSVFAENEGAGVAFGGVSLNAGTVSSPRRFAFNTVAANRDTGVLCADAYPLTASLLSNNTGNDVVQCTVGADSRVGGNAALSADYHLTDASPCKDGVPDVAQLPADARLTSDIDGEPRPQGARYDCGSDELLVR